MPFLWTPRLLCWFWERKHQNEDMVALSLILQFRRPKGQLRFKKTARKFKLGLLLCVNGVSRLVKSHMCICTHIIIKMSTTCILYDQFSSNILLAWSYCRTCRQPMIIIQSTWAQLCGQTCMKRLQRCQKVNVWFVGALKPNLRCGSISSLRVSRTNFSARNVINGVSRDPLAYCRGFWLILLEVLIQLQYTHNTKWTYIKSHGGTRSASWGLIYTKMGGQKKCILEPQIQIQPASYARFFLVFFW